MSLLSALMLAAFSQLHAQSLVHPQRLADAQIQHNLLTATGDRIRPDISVKAFYLSALTAAAVTQTTEDLAGLAGAELKSGGCLGLETGNGTAEFQHGLHLVHLLALVDKVFHPRVGCFDLAEHVG